jgi:hypothetical protein
MSELHRLKAAGLRAVTACLGAAMLLAAPAAHATACRITDFSDRTLSSLSERQRLSFLTEMSPTEFTRIKASAPGSPNYDAIVAASANAREARDAARSKLEAFGMENFDNYRMLSASDWLTDKGLQDLGNCISSRQPGLLVLGRAENPSEFHITLTHLTPIGIEKIRTQLVATYNIANVPEFEQFLLSIGNKDNYKATTFPLKIADPKKRAVVILRGGWETPVSLYIPAAGATAP